MPRVPLPAPKPRDEHAAAVLAEADRRLDEIDRTIADALCLIGRVPVSRW